MGPGFTNKNEPVTTPRFLLEVGGGSAAVDLYAIQIKLADKYSVCGYDRAGYGKSWQAADQLSNSTMDITVKAMKEVGFPIEDGKRDVICVGHSAGGQLCRHYAKNLPSIRGAYLLDSYSIMNLFQVEGKLNGKTVEEVYNN
jgi:pimeloyl-ACP methyl ester carboxylesterase